MRSAIRSLLPSLFVVAVGFMPAPPVFAQSAMSLGVDGALNGWVPSPNDPWHQDVSAVPLDTTSTVPLTDGTLLSTTFLHPDFGSASGIPYTVIDSSQPGTPWVQLTPFIAGDSDNTLFPLSATTVLEGATTPGACWTDTDDDHHGIVIDRATGVDYETYQADLCAGVWSSYAQIIWDFTLPNGEQRPYGATSTDAAGLSVFEGLIRYDEILAGVINHAIRFTAPHSKCVGAGPDMDGGYGAALFEAPATHGACNQSSGFAMGARIRLDASFDISSYSPTNQIILTAMKKYGMILADNGSAIFFQGTSDPRWDDNDLGALKNIPSSAFDLLQQPTQMTADSHPTGAAPQVSLTASASTVAPGGSVTLTPVSNGSYQYIDKVGFTRAPVTVSPAASTTYTLTSRNLFGTTSSTATVGVTGSGTTGGGTTNPPPPVSGPTGTVSFYNGQTLLGTSPIVNGVATLTFTPSAGQLTLTAVYSGDSSNATSTSTADSVMVATPPPPAAPTTTTLILAPSAPIAGQAATISATVSPQ